jgi:zinc protease
VIEAVAANLSENGVTDDIFDRAIKPTLENLETSLENNSYWLNVIDEAQGRPETLDRHRTRDVTYQNMMAAEISAVAKDVFNGDKAIRVHVVPEG